MQRKSVALIGTLSILCASCSQFVGQSDWGSTTPLLTDFREFCINTDARPADVDAVALGKGLKLSASFDEWHGRYGPMKGWNHRSGDHVISLQSGLMERENNLGAKVQEYCMAGDILDNGESMEGLQKWLGAKSDRLTFSQFYEFELIDGRPHLLADKDIVGIRKAIAAGRMYIIVVNSQLGSTMITLNHVG